MRGNGSGLAPLWGQTVGKVSLGRATGYHQARSITSPFEPVSCTSVMIAAAALRLRVRRGTPTSNRPPQWPVKPRGGRGSGRTVEFFQGSRASPVTLEDCLVMNEPPGAEPETAGRILWARSCAGPSNWCSEHGMSGERGPSNSWPLANPNHGHRLPQQASRVLPVPLELLELQEATVRRTERGPLAW